MDAYLSEFINAIKFITPDHNVIAIQDINLIHVYHTTEYFKLLGYQELSLLGKPLNVVTNKIIQNNLGAFLTFSTYVKTTKSPAKYVIGYEPPNNIDGYNWYLIKQSPIVNPKTDLLVGILIEIEYLELGFINQINNIPKKILQNYQDSYSALLQPVQHNIKLSTREEEVLFLLFFGETYKGIANILSNAYEREIKETSISSVVYKQLYIKLDVYSIDSLKKKSLELNLIMSVPKKLIPQLEGIIAHSQL